MPDTKVRHYRQLYYNDMLGTERIYYENDKIKLIKKKASKRDKKIQQYKLIFPATTRNWVTFCSYYKIKTREKIN